MILVVGDRLTTKSWLCLSVGIHSWTYEVRRNRFLLVVILYRKADYGLAKGVVEGSKP